MLHMFPLASAAKHWAPYLLLFMYHPPDSEQTLIKVHPCNTQHTSTALTFLYIYQHPTMWSSQLHASSACMHNQTRDWVTWSPLTSIPPWSKAPPTHPPTHSRMSPWHTLQKTTTHNPFLTLGLLDLDPHISKRHSNKAGSQHCTCHAVHLALEVPQ